MFCPCFEPTFVLKTGHHAVRKYVLENSYPVNDLNAALS